MRELDVPGVDAGFLPGRAAAPPLCLRPRGDERSAGALAAALGAAAVQVRAALAEHGALLLRGFAVRAPADLEAVAGAIAAPGPLGDTYLGTSPRRALSRHVFTASELPGWYPIPQHCEMSFVARPPRWLFFWCVEPPAKGSGETPLCDMRAVARDLDPAVRARFEVRGIRIVRNYTGPEGGGRLNLWQLKRWDEMFATTDRAAAEARARAEGFEVSWQPGGRMRLVSRHPALRAHPETGEAVWFNHAQVFHQAAAPGELARILRLRPSARALGTWALARALVAVGRRTRGDDEHALHCTFGDGAPISDADLAHVGELIWRHLVVFPWERGDVVAIDNYAVAHGRLPYRGPREIAVAWAAGAP